MQTYESHFFTSKTLTGWPFREEVLPKGFITDFTMCSDRRVFFNSISTQMGVSTITIVDIEDAIYATITITGNGVYEIKKVNQERTGWVEIGDYSILNISRKVEIIYGINFTWDNIDGRQIYLDGYNCHLSVDGQEVSIIFNRGAGYGEYCGNDKKYDGIYTVNAISPNYEGKMTWTESGFFRIRTGEHEIIFDLLVPDEICTRPGNKGPKGDTGPRGAPGQDGLDAIEIDVDFDPYCERKT